MAPISGIRGRVECSDTGKDLHHIINTGSGPYAFTLNATAPVQPYTVFGVNTTTAGRSVGLAEWTADVSARFPRTPSNAYAASITYAAGYARLVQSFALNFTCEAESYVPEPADNATYRPFVPGLISAGGTYTALVDDSVPLVGPTLQGSAGTIATFKLTEDGATDRTIAGNIVITGVSPSASNESGLQQVTYTFEFDGAVTVAGSNNLLPTGVVDTPDITDVTFRATTGRTYTGPCFWSRLSLNVDRGALADVSMTLQGAGQLVIA